MKRREVKFLEKERTKMMRQLAASDVETSSQESYDSWQGEGQPTKRKK